MQGLKWFRLRIRALNLKSLLVRLKAYFQQKTKQKQAKSADSAEKGTGIEQESARLELKGNTGLEKRVHKYQFLVSQSKHI